MTISAVSAALAAPAVLDSPAGPMPPTAPTAPAAPPYDLERVRADFPILSRQVHGKPLVYLDNAASTQKPRQVQSAMTDCYCEYYANVSRGVHTLSQRSTDERERARATVQRFLGAARPEEIVFVRGVTEGINLVAQSWGRRNVGPGDEILITEMEHHSNIVPWQLLCEERGATLRWIPIDDDGDLRLDELDDLLSNRTRLVAVAHVSNALGTINPVREIVEQAHRHGAVVLVDGAQAAPHLAVDVQALGCDFYVFSGHKVYGPSGIGALYGRYDLLAAMPPWQGGGGMIHTVSLRQSTYAEPPHRFEAGTPHIEGAIGLAAALDYLAGLGVDGIDGIERIAAWEAQLLALATDRLSGIPGLRPIGTARHKAAVLSFTLDGVHPHDVGTILDREGIAVRAGHHCAQPVMERFAVPATTRASFGLYNTAEEVEALAAALVRVQEIFGR